MLMATTQCKDADMRFCPRVLFAVERIDLQHVLSGKALHRAFCASHLYSGLLQHSSTKWHDDGGCSFHAHHKFGSVWSSRDVIYIFSLASHNEVESVVVFAVLCVPVTIPRAVTVLSPLESLSAVCSATNKLADLAASVPASSREPCTHPSGSKGKGYN